VSATDRRLETALAYVTLALLVLYVPLETWVSLPYGLTNPFYIIDVIAMVLLFAGAMHSLRSRPRPAPGLLCAAIAWTAANGWRATFDRIVELRRGESLDYGAAELWAVALSTLISLGGFAIGIYLVVRADAHRPTPTVV
jgi:hypothetical protein